MKRVNCYVMQAVKMDVGIISKESNKPVPGFWKYMFGLGISGESGDGGTVRGGSRCRQ